MKQAFKLIGIALIALALICLACSQSDAQTRCKAIKKDGTQCKMMTTNPNGFCQFHQADKYQHPEKQIHAAPYTIRINSDNSFTLMDGNRAVGTFNDPTLDAIITKDNE